VKIIGVSTIKDEPNIGRTIQHMRDQGVDRFIVSVEDYDTRNIVSKTGVFTEFVELPFNQGAEITRLARMAARMGADWIVPFDADEYWCGPGPQTVRESLKQEPAGIDTLYAPMVLHITPELRAVQKKPLPKVAFRPRDDMTVAWGSHDVTGVRNGVEGFLVVREWQYESYEHFLTKIQKAHHLHTQPHMANSPHGTHMQRLTTLTDVQLRAVWDQHLATPTVHDPIPGSDKWT
jgi:hypothetical protein